MANSGILDLSAGGGSVPPNVNLQAELDKKVDLPVAQTPGAVAIVDPTGNQLAYRKFLAKDIAVDVGNFKALGNENELGINQGDVNLQRVVDKLEAYAKAIINDPDSGEVWQGGGVYPAKETFTVTPTQTSAVDANGKKLKQGMPVLMRYAGAVDTNASATLTLAEIARMEVVAGGGSSLAKDTEYDDTVSKLAGAGIVTNVQKAIEVMNDLINNNPEQEYLADIPARDAIVNPKKGALVYVLDASADTNIGIGNGWANYVFSGGAWELRTSKKELHNVIELVDAQFDPAHVAYSGKGTTSFQQLDRWLKQSAHPQLADVQTMTGDALLSNTKATFVSVKPTGDNYTITLPQPDPSVNMARIITNPTTHSVKVNQTGIGVRGTLPPMSTTLIDNSTLEPMPSDNANQSHIFLDKTTLAPANADDPQSTEAKVAFAGATDKFGFYTGTDLATDPIMAIFHIDAKGNVITLESNKPKIKPNIVYVTDAEINPAIGTNATTAEMEAYLATLTPKDKAFNTYMYNGTTLITDPPKMIYYADADGDVVMVDKTDFPALPSKIEFLSMGAVGAANTKAPSKAEIEAAVKTLKHRETVVYYTGTNVATDDKTSIWYVDNYFNAIKLANNDPEKLRIHKHLSKTAVNSADTDKPTIVEIEAALSIMIDQTDRIAYYTGTDNPADVPTYIYYVDEAKKAKLLTKPKPPKNRVFLNKGSFNPVDANEPTMAEIQTGFGTNREVIGFYTTTNNAADAIYRVYHIDTAGDVTTIFKATKPNEKKDIILLTDAQISPARAGKAKVSEVKAYILTLAPEIRKNKFYIYTGTNDINDNAKIVFLADSDGDITKTEDELLPERTAFAKDSLLNPVSSLHPTEVEVKQYALTQKLRDCVIRYTGTDNSNDLLLSSFFVDYYGIVTRLYKKADDWDDGWVFLKNADITPIVPGQPTEAEIGTAVTMLNIKSKHCFYTGTDVSGDAITKVYYVDSNKKANLIENFGELDKRTTKQSEHISATALGSVNKNKPLVAEVAGFLAPNKDNPLKTSMVYYYTGDDNPTAPTTYSYWLDFKGKVTPLFAPNDDMTTKFIKESAIAPAIAGKPTVSEVKTAVVARGLKNRFFVYTGTESDSTGVYKGIYHIDNNNKFAVLLDPNAKDDVVSYMHLTDADISPVKPKAATYVEFTQAIANIPIADRLNHIFTYTGTNDPVDVPIFTVSVDEAGVTTALFKAVRPKNVEIDFIKASDLTVVEVGKPTEAEVLTYALAKGDVYKMYKYTGTDLSTDSIKGTFYLNRDASKVIKLGGGIGDDLGTETELMLGIDTEGKPWSAETLKKGINNHISAYKFWENSTTTYGDGSVTTNRYDERIVIDPIDFKLYKARIDSIPQGKQPSTSPAEWKLFVEDVKKGNLVKVYEIIDDYTHSGQVYVPVNNQSSFFPLHIDVMDGDLFSVQVSLDNGNGTEEQTIRLRRNEARYDLTMPSGAAMQLRINYTLKRYSIYPAGKSVVYIGHTMQRIVQPSSPTMVVDSTGMVAGDTFMFDGSKMVKDLQADTRRVYSTTPKLTGEVDGDGKKIWYRDINLPISNTGQVLDIQTGIHRLKSIDGMIVGAGDVSASLQYRNGADEVSYWVGYGTLQMKNTWASSGATTCDFRIRYTLK